MMVHPVCQIYLTIYLLLSFWLLLIFHCYKAYCDGHLCAYCFLIAALFKQMSFRNQAIYSIVGITFEVNGEMGHNYNEKKWGIT